MVSPIHKRNLKFWAVVIAMLLSCPSFLYAEERVIESDQVKLILESSEGWNIPDGDTLKIVYIGNDPDPQALLRDISGNPSYWGGTFWSNYNVLFVNPNGITFGPNANIQAASFIASTLNISNADFLNGKFNFYKDGKNAFILNQGNIIVRNGGYIALLSQAVENQGTILASLGTVVLAGGEKMTLALDDLNEISVVIDEAVKEAVIGPNGEKILSAVKNSGTVTANGGKVILTAKVLNNVFDHAINNTGVIEAKSLVNRNGVIELVGEGAPIVNTGRLEAGQIKVKAQGTEFINKGKVIAGSQTSVPESGKINVQANSLVQGGLISADKIVQVEAERVDVVLDGPLALEIDPLMNTSPGVIIQAPEVKIIAKQFGSNTVPLNIDAATTYINRTQGDINILDSLGIGTSVLLRGPPSDFGAIVYNRDSNLTLQADHVYLVGSAPTYLYGNITFSNFTCTVPSKEIYFEAGKTYTILGTFKIQGASEQHVRLLSTEEDAYWYIDPQGVRDITYAWVKDSYNLHPEKIIMTESTNRGHCFNWDPTATWTGAVSNLWSEPGNWSGLGEGQTPGAGDDVVINLDNAAVTLNIGATINSLTIGGSTSGTGKSGITLTFSGSNSLTVNGAVIVNGPWTDNTNNTIIVGAGTLTAGSISLTGRGTSRIGSITVSAGTINVSSDITFGGGVPTNGQITSTGTINIGGNLESGGTFNVGTAGTVNYNGADQTVRHNYAYYNLTLSGSGTKTISGTGATVTVNGDLTVSSGVTLSLASGESITGSGAGNALDVYGILEVNNLDFSVNYAGFETITMQTNSVVDYSKAAAQNIDSGFQYYNLILSGSGTKTAGGALIVNGDLTTSNTAVFVYGAFTHTFKGNWTINSTAASPITATGGSVINFNTPGTPAATSLGGSTTKTIPFVDLNINNTSGFTLNKNATVSGTLTVTGTTLTNNGTLTVTTALSGNGGLTQGTNAVLNIGGTSGISALTSDASGNTVQYNGTAAQTIKGTTYYILKINNAAGGTLDAVATVTTLTIGDVTAGSIFSDGGYQVTSTGTLNLTRGTFKLGAGTATTFPVFTTINISSGTTAEYVAGAAQAVSTTPSYQNLTFSGAGTKTTTSGTLSIAGDWAVGSATTLNTNNTIVNLTGDLTGAGDITQGTGAINIGGDWTNAGTFTAGAGGVDYNGSAAQSVKGAAYQKLTISGSGTKTLAGDATVNGDLTITNSIFVVGAYNFTVTGATDISGTLRITNTTGDKIFGDITVNNGGIFDFNANETITMNGNLQIDGSITGSSTWIFQKSGGSGTVSGTATSVSLTNATFTTSYTNRISTLSIGTLTINGTTLTNNGTLTVSTELAGTGTLAQGEDSILNINITDANFTLAFLNTSASRNTVSYGRGAAQHIKTPISNKYWNLTLANTGIKSAVADLTIEGDFTISGSARFTTGAFTHIFKGNWTVDTSAATPITATGSTINFNSPTVAAATAINNGTTTATLALATVNINNTSGFSCNENISVSGTLTIASGVTFTPGATNVISGAGTLAGNGTAQVTRIAATPDFSSQYSITNKTLTNLTVEYVGAGAQTVSALAYGNLKINMPGQTATLGDAATVNGNLTISSGTLAASTYTLTIGGNWINAGTFSAGSGTVTFNGNTTISGSSTTSFNNVTINSGKSLTSPASGTINVSGNWTNSGTFNANGGTVTFNGTSQSDITGNNGFYNLTINTAADGAKTIRFGAGNTQTITHTLILTGAAGKVLTLRSTTSGTQATLSIPSSIASGVNYLDVKDNKIDGANTITARYSEDSGNNTHWTITGAPAKVNVETTADGSGTIVAAQDLSSGSSITVYSITRDSNDRFIENIAADSWALTNITGAVVSGDLVAAADIKSATLTGHKVGTAKIGATSGALTKNSSGTITVIPGSAASLVFVQQPTDTKAGSSITPAPQVEIKDVYDNLLVADNSTTISINIQDNPGGGAISGTLTRTTSGGVASFSGLSINKAGTGYTLRATSGTINAAISSQFNITTSSSESQIANTEILIYIFPAAVQLGQYRINTFIPVGGPVYLYHPLTTADMSIFEEIERGR